MPWIQIDTGQPDAGAEPPAERLDGQDPVPRPAKAPRSGAALFLAGLLLALAVGGVVAGLLWLKLGATARAPGVADPGRAPDTVVAMINDEPITARQVEVELIIQKRLHEQQGQVLTENPDDLSAFRRDILDQLVDQALIAQEAARQGIAISGEQLQAQLPSLARGFDMELLKAAVFADGVEEDEFLGWGRRQLVVTAYMQTDDAMSKVKGHLEATGRGLTFGLSPGDLASALQADADVRFVFEGFEGGTGEGLPMVREGKPAPAFSLPTLAGVSAGVADFIGRPVLVNFWATWCVPCRTEMPLFVALYEARAAEGLEILGVNVQERADLVAPFVEEFGLGFPILMDADGEVATLFRVKGLPTTFFVGADGIVRRAHRGAILNAAQLDGFVDEIVAPQGALAPALPSVDGGLGGR